MNQSIQYMKFTPDDAATITTACAIVNDWAQKKGWNEEKTEEAKLIDHAIARRMKMIQEICDDIEKIRKNGSPEDYRIVGLSDEQAADIASFGLMATELSEAAEAVESLKVGDDHLPELGATDAEMADLCIRVFHFCGKRDIHLGRAIMLKHKYNCNRPHKHGKKA